MVRNMLGGKFANLNRTAGASVGSKVTPSAMKKAMTTASGASPKLPTESPSSANIRPKARINPGSRAGLKDAKSVHLTANNTGYLNPANQHARIKDRTKIVDTSINRSLPAFKATNRVYDNRFTSSNKSSPSLLNKRFR